MIIKEIVKSKIIPSIYKALTCSPSAAGRYSGFVKDASFFAKTAPNTGIMTEPIVDVSKFMNRTKDIPVEVRSMNQSVGRCIDFLQGTNPREYAVMLDETTGKILQEGVGSPSEVRINFSIENTSLNLKNAKLAMLHGHTPITTASGKMTLPVSLQDFITLNETKLNKIVAFNSKGQCSVLEKLESFVKLKDSDIEVIKKKYMEELLEQSPIEKTKKIRNLMQYVKENSQLSAHKRELVNLLNSLQYEEGADIIIDGFWRKHAHKYGLKYTSWITV